MHALVNLFFPQNCCGVGDIIGNLNYLITDYYLPNLEEFIKKSITLEAVEKEAQKVGEPLSQPKQSAPGHKSSLTLSQPGGAQHQKNAFMP